MVLAGQRLVIHEANARECVTLVRKLGTALQIEIKAVHS
jgi:hypothetical protein